MTNKIVIRLFFCLALIQLVVPFSMIAKRECALSSGVQLKFKVAPVDPYDAFRGRYVALRVEENQVPVTKGEEFRHGQTVFALIAVDEQEFAKFTGVTVSRPSGQAYIQAKVSGCPYDNKVRLDLPIDRYYMEETAAPLAQKLYQEHAQRKKQDAYVLVRVKDGLAVIESLYVGQERIEDAVKKGMAR